MIFYGAFESTCIHDGKGDDVLGNTRHIDFWRQDLRTLLDSGIRDLR
jgi:hypothetical protein